MTKFCQKEIKSISKMNSNQIQHLYWRAGFGLNPSQFKNLKGKSKKEIVANLFSDSENSSKILVVKNNEYFDWYKDFKSLSREKKQELQKFNRKKIVELNVAWVKRLFAPKELMRERMTLFWANHFVCKDNNSFHFQMYNNILRNNALGNFKDFLKEVSKSASMIKYLNAKQNKKQSPNENFSRELMELFTLGIGNYTENDIKEGAKAFTGWNHKLNGDFILRKHGHDFGKKDFFGEKGNFGGEDIIDIILSKRQCAKFICEKIYSYFVNTKIDSKHIEELTNVFFPKYNIEELMRHIFMSNWFYDKKNIGTKIKSPIELIVGINNIVPIEFQSNKQLYIIQKRLGQQLLNPINVAGWKMGKNWIDSNTLMLRLKLPSLLLNNAVISLSGISEFEDTYEQYLKSRKRKKGLLKIIQNWEFFNNNFNNLNKDQMEKVLLSENLKDSVKDVLSSITFTNHKDYCIQIMSLPEYQLC